jgi:alcohol dehydrogenase class IV
MPFEFASAGRLIFGAGASRQAAPLARASGSRALLVTGRDTARAQFLLDSLRDNAVAAVLFPVPGEPEIDTVRQGAALGLREQCALVISLGGGSALDAGKAIAAMLTNPGDVLDYLEVIGAGKSLAKPSAPFIAIPTTAGTGAEVTRNAVLSSPDHRQKVSLRSPSLLPAIAIVDPELTWPVPPPITASTGLDALTQLIEPFVSSRANPFTDALCVQAIPRVAASLRIAFHDGRNAPAREDMSLASLFGGFALANAGLGAVHGFAAALGGMFPAPHGALCAALLPHVMDANLRALQQREPRNDALRRYGVMARLLTGRPAAEAPDAIQWVRQLAADLRIPPLGHYGLTPADFADVARKASKASSMKANPLVLTPEELLQILARAL